MPVYLKSIELMGFKSFPNRSRIDFIEGITGIVGPNGCGKSNVVEAIKWVLGEQSPKSLRGEKMEDVIFNGTKAGRAATGMAEVMLTFNNETHWLPVDYAEVQVGRRIFRSSEGQYILNKSRIRLKDMVELFLDTGIGRDSYAIFEQGKIDRLLSESPKERRILFEDLAGISRFKFRKEEAERKLESSRQNMERIQDLIIELEKEVNSLQSQADDANRYHDLREKLKDLEVKFEALRIRNIRNDIAKKEEEKAELDRKLQPLVEEIKSKESGIQQTDDDIIVREQAFSSMNEQYNLQEREYTEINSNLRNDKDRLSSLENSLVDMENRVKAEAERFLHLQQELSDKENEFKTVKSEKEKMDSVLAEMQGKIDEVSRAIDQLNQVTSERSRQLGFQRIISKDDIERVRGEILTLQTRQEGYRGSIEEKWRTLKNLEKEKLERDHQLEKASSDMSSMKGKQEELKAKIDEIINKERDIKQQNQNHSNEIRSLQEELRSMDRVIMDSLEKQSVELKQFTQKKPLLEAKMESAVSKLALAIETDAPLAEKKELLNNLRTLFDDYRNHYESILGILYSDEGTYTRKENIQNRVEELTGVIYDNEQKLEQLRAELVKRQAERADINSAYARSEFEHGTVRREIEKLTVQIEGTQTSMKELENQINATADKINQRQNQIDNMVSVVDEYDQKIQELRQKRNEHQEKLNEKKIGFARVEEQFKSMGSEIGRIKNQLGDIERMQKNFENDRQNTVEHIATLKQRITDNSKRVESLNKEIEKSRKTIEKEKEIIEKLKNSRRTMEVQVRALSERIQKIELSIMNIETSIDDHKVTLQAGIDNIRNTYSVDVNTVHLAEEDNIDDVAKETRQVRGELSKMGDVNLLAIEQFQEAKERLEFLLSQKVDIEKAMNDIVTLIEETDRKSTERFLESFEEIRKAFRKVFTRLFEGGRADLVLEDPNNPLTSGIDILAEPPGKKFQSVSLLSGGERALVAIAVVFAILYLKPTPFVVLDEMDAPLDDDNIDRFKKLLFDFKGTTQFVIVSHSKSTLEVCDTLYGVTMEELGVSKVINVAFDQAELLFKEEPK